MFEKKDIIYSETLGVCQVAEVTRLSSKSGEQILYYGLRSVYDKNKVSYIPVEKHQVHLRKLISEEEAQELQKNPSDSLTDLQQKEIEYVLSHSQTGRR